MSRDWVAESWALGGHVVDTVIFAIYVAVLCCLSKYPLCETNMKVWRPNNHSNEDFNGAKRKVPLNTVTLPSLQGSDSG